jgi:hypothetical protein
MGPHAHSGTASHGENGDRGDSLEFVLDTARRAYEQQVATFERHRARAGALLAFAAVLVTVSGAARPIEGYALLQASGTFCVLLAAVVFLTASSWPGLRLVPTVRWFRTAEVEKTQSASEARLLRSLLFALETNQRPLQRISTLLSIGLFWLLAGTSIIGARLTLLLL